MLFPSPAPPQERASSRPSRRPFTRKQRLLLLLAISFLPVTLLILALATWWVYREGKDAIIDHPENLTEPTTALVLGCSPTLPDGRKNLFFILRIKAAAELYHRGKISRMILSGDRSSDAYDEPRSMKLALIEKGVPSHILIEDGLGKRTLESMKRAAEVFKIQRLIIVSQPDHALRAHYLARKYGMETTIWPAREVKLRGGLRTHLREAFSRLYMLYEVHLQ